MRETIEAVYSDETVIVDHCECCVGLSLSVRNDGHTATAELDYRQVVAPAALLQWLIEGWDNADSDT